MTTVELQEAIPANSVSYMRTRTVEEAINAVEVVERPFMDALRKRQNMWMKFWNRRGSNPITEVVEEYAN